MSRLFKRTGAGSYPAPILECLETRHGDYIMKIELDARRFSEGWGVFDVGCVLGDQEGNREIEIVKFSGYSEIDETNGTADDVIVVHFDDGRQIEFETLERDVIRERKYEPVGPDWFIEEVAAFRGDPTPEQAEAEAKAEAERKSKAESDRVMMRLSARIKAEIPQRPVEAYTDQELMAKISGAPLAVAEDVFLAYEGNLMRMAGSTAKQMRKIGGIGAVRSEKIIAAFELGKRLARFHVEKEKISAPSDVAALMMSKLRYLHKEIVVVLALDTKGQVTSTGKTGELASGLKWGKMVAESTIFEGTLNASVFHPREIFRFAIEECANSIVLVHNHPSGDPQPSQEDIRATKQLIEAGNQIGIKVLDHIVIGDGIFVSLKEEGFI